MKIVNKSRESEMPTAWNKYLILLLNSLFQIFTAYETERT